MPAGRDLFAPFPQPTCAVPGGDAHVAAAGATGAGARRDQPVPPRPSRQEPDQRGDDRVARRSTAAPCRDASSFAFLDVGERLSRTSRPQSRAKIRQSRRSDTADPGSSLQPTGTGLLLAPPRCWTTSQPAGRLQPPPRARHATGRAIWPGSCSPPNILASCAVQACKKDDPAGGGAVPSRAGRILATAGMVAGRSWHQRRPGQLAAARPLPGWCYSPLVSRPSAPPAAALLSLAISAGGASGTASGLGTPLNTNVASFPVPSASTMMICPAFSSPNRMFSDRESSISRWIVRRSGRAPSTGS